ncbi:MAG: hypothetical protein Q9168_004209 [Polycauliona sp. 1 TL-2023]
MATHTGQSASSQVVVADKDHPIPFKYVTATFAIDVSSSTSLDDILVQEKNAILDLSAHLSSDAKARARVLPWDEKANPPIKTTDTDGLRPGWGTNPTVLVSDKDHQAFLRHCSLWFLLTDGAISVQEVREFAEGVGKQGLHGTACVIIIFGIRPPRPSRCKISVGQAVFAVAPDCAFLFHDVNTEEVYILQCKGCFRALLPPERAEIVIDQDVAWKDIPRTSYESLANIAVPRPREVKDNAIILESGQVVDLDGLYNDSLSPAMVAEVLDSDDNLKSVLLAAQNRGKSKEIEDWITKQTVSRMTAAFVDRPDLGGNTLLQIETLVTSMQHSLHDPDSGLQQSLRKYHQANWDNFIELPDVTTPSSDRVERRNNVVNDALVRVKLNRKYPTSASNMSPVSPLGARSSGSGHAPQRSRTPYVAQDDQRDFQTRNTPVPLEPDGTERDLHQKSPYFPQSQSPKNPDVARLLYMKGYMVDLGLDTPQLFRGHCSLCGEDNVPLAILLKAPPADCETEGDFPAPNSQCDIKSPLAMGNFSETDIISSFLGCERCAHFIRTVGRSPLDESIKGAIPLIRLSNNTNRESMLKEINAALECRFNKSILDQIFLSVLYSKLDDAINDPRSKPLLVDALRWQCRNFLGQISLQDDLSSWDDPTGKTIREPLSTTMSAILASSGGLGLDSLIGYPVDGFVVLLMGSIDLGIVGASDDVVKRVVFQRLLYHLVEQRAMLSKHEGDTAVADLVHRIQPNQPDGMNLDRLKGTSLLDEDTFNSFLKLDDAFDCVVKYYGGATWHFLQLMINVEWEGVGSEKTFTALKATYKGEKVLREPWAWTGQGYMY